MPPLFLDWARCEPAPGRFDDETFAHYRSVLSPTTGLAVCLHDGSLPDWLSLDFWLDLRSPDRFAEWAGAAADRLGDAGRSRSWVSVYELNTVAYRSWFTGTLPPGRIGRTGDMVRALGHLMTAHVLAERALQRRRPGATVELHLRPLAYYELGQLLVDVLEAPRRDVARRELRAWLRERREEFYAARPRPRPVERVLRAAIAGAVPLEQAFPRAIAAVAAP